LKKWIRILTVVVLALLAAGPVPAADQEKETIRLVLVPERNIFDQEKKYRLLSDYLNKHLPFHLVFDVLSGYEEVMDQIVKEQAHGGIVGSFLVAHGVEEHDMTPLVRPEWISADSYYRSYIFKQAGSKLTKDVHSWKGTAIALVNRHTSAGYFFPMALLKREGVDDPEGFFSNIIFTGSHDAPVWMVARGLADIGAAKDIVFEETLRKRPELREKVEVLHVGGRFPDATLVVGPNVPDSVRNTLQSAFLDMDSTFEGKKVLNRFGAAKFIHSPIDDYGDVYQVVKDAGFNIHDMWVVGH